VSGDGIEVPLSEPRLLRTLTQVTLREFLADLLPRYPRPVAGAVMWLLRRSAGPEWFDRPSYVVLFALGASVTRVDPLRDVEIALPSLLASRRRRRGPGGIAARLSLRPATVSSTAVELHLAFRTPAGSTWATRSPADAVLRRIARPLLRPLLQTMANQSTIQRNVGLSQPKPATT